ncbi:MAG: two-component response regulator [Gammaproteobacteria bacterium]|jgi:FixJ family two-component response regulator|nr:two-component response regulator [Gammaproteobacteria bacterium]
MKPGEPIVFVVDDDASVREALASLIGSVALRVECFASSGEFLRRRRSENPSCLVLDVRMPGLSGLDLQRKLARAEQQIPIIFISAHGDIPMAVEAMKAGAIEFLPKPFRDEDLLDAIRQALYRDEAAKARRSEVTGIRTRHARLTARQHQIMTRIVEGKLNKQIAAELELSENTIKVHRRRIMDRMGASSVAELVQMIERLG